MEIPDLFADDLHADQSISEAHSEPPKPPKPSKPSQAANSVSFGGFGSSIYAPKILNDGPEMTAAEVVTKVEARGGWLFLRDDGLGPLSFPECITAGEIGYWQKRVRRHEPEIVAILRQRITWSYR